MEICPKCKKSRHIDEVIETDATTHKRWLITRCKSCGYNFDIDEWITKKKCI